MGTIQVTNPYDLSLIEEVPLMSGEDVENALQKASRKFDDRSSWLPGYERIAILERTGTLMSERADTLAQLACREGGKPLQDSIVEVERAIQGVKLAAEHISQLGGEQIPMEQTPSTSGRLAFTQREPIGVVVSISAFNHPLNLIIHQTVPAIAAGAPVIIKPSKTTPLSCLNFVSILHEAGLPEDWCQVVVCENEHAEKLVTDSRIGFFSFIGSANLGWKLRSKLASGVRCALEHGGAAPAIVEEDADLTSAVPLLLKGGFYHSGQVCVSVQRIYAHVDILEELKDLLVSQAAEITNGDPLLLTTEAGPLILPREVERVSAWVDEAVEAGATVLIGGKKLSETTYAPTILLNPPEDAKVSKKEIFGPVVCLYSYSDRDDAIARANSLPYAFQSAIFTQDIDRALDASSRLNATAVMINDHTAFRADWMPFGGRDASGLGMGGIPHSIHEMTREKMTVIKLK